MSRRSIAILALLAGLTACGRHACAQNPPVSAEAVQLVYKFAPGEVARYKITQRLTGTRTLPGSAEPTRIDAELAATVRLRCMRVLAGGDAELRLEVESGSLKIAGRQANSFPGSSETRTIYVTPYGRVTGPEQQGRAGNDPRRFLMGLDAIESILFSAVLPERPVKIGDSWTAEVQLPLEPPAKLNLSFALQNLKQASGDWLATVKRVQTTPVSADVAADSSAPLTRQDGQADLVFAVGKGKLVSVQGTMRSTLTATVQLPPAPGAQAPQNAGQASSEPRATVSTWSLDAKFTAELLDK